jgi:hypothetical protein
VSDYLSDYAAPSRLKKIQSIASAPRRCAKMSLSCSQPWGFGCPRPRLAQELESETLGGQGWLSIEQANPGSLQRQVAEAPGMDSNAGISPRQISQYLDRGDEPNIRTALAAMQKRG